MFVSKESIEKLLDFKELVDALEAGFLNGITSPVRHHHLCKNEGRETNTHLLLMPSWDESFIGVKMITVATGNQTLNLPTVQGIYALSSVQTGEPLAYFDAKTITNWRTVATSVLATQLLFPACKKLFIVGTGELASFFIRGYLQVFQIQKVMLWGRDKQKAKRLMEAQMMKHPSVEFEVVDLEKGVGQADVVSTLTSATSPLIKGRWVKGNKHFDLVGSYAPTMREVDNDLIRKSKIVLDDKKVMPHESGDIRTPLEERVIDQEDLDVDLFDLLRERERMKRDGGITLFKSVGLALEDLVMARLIYSKL